MRSAPTMSLCCHPGQVAHRATRAGIQYAAVHRGGTAYWIPGLAEPAIGPRYARTRWLARDDREKRP